MSQEVKSPEVKSPVAKKKRKYSRLTTSFIRAPIASQVASLNKAFKLGTPPGVENEKVCQFIDAVNEGVIKIPSVLTPQQRVKLSAMKVPGLPEKKVSS